MKNDSLRILEQLYLLFEEANLKRADEEVLEEIRQNPNPSYDRHLKHIRKLNTQARASIQKNWFAKAQNELEKLIDEIGKNDLIDGLLAQPKYQALGAFFSKYENISSADKESMLTDKKILDLVKELKKEVANEENPE